MVANFGAVNRSHHLVLFFVQIDYLRSGNWVFTYPKPVCIEWEHLAERQGKFAYLNNTPGTLQSVIQIFFFQGIWLSVFKQVTVPQTVMWSGNVAFRPLHLFCGVLPVAQYLHCRILAWSTHLKEKFHDDIGGVPVLATLRFHVHHCTAFVKPRKRQRTLQAPRDSLFSTDASGI